MQLAVSGDAPAALPTGRWRVTEVSAPMGAGIRVRVFAPDGLLATGGYAAEVAGAFACDRIVTTEAHRRRGPGRARMLRLAAGRRDPANADVRAPTPAGRAPYATMSRLEASLWRPATVSVQ